MSRAFFAFPLVTLKIMAAIHWEALRLWVDLMRHGVEAKFLYFPDENHWVLKPQHARVWYETVFAWLDHHLLGKEWQRPEML